MTEGNGHLIDPGGGARRALQAAVAEHGARALSDPETMDRVGREELAGQPAEATLISGATRANVAGRLRELIPRLGNYGAIQSVASTLAETGALEMTAALWVVREFARALGLVAGTRTDPDEGAPAAAAPETAPAVAAPAAAAGPVAPVTSAAAGDGSPAAPPDGAGPVPTPGRPAARVRRLSRNVVGIGAALALVLIYLGVASATHLTPFPAKTTAARSPAGGGRKTGATPGPDASPASAYDTLLSRIPADVASQAKCADIGTDVGATAVAQCSTIQGLAAENIFYYSFASQRALISGFKSFLAKESFKKGQTSCTTSDNQFADFVVQCEDGFTSTTPEMTGDVAEYANTDHAPIIVSSDNQQLVMVVMTGADDGDLLAYWKKLDWISP